MTHTTERACRRGCTIKGEHYATCADYGRDAEGDCRGCAPRVAVDGSLICGRCFGRLRRNLDAAADLLDVLRTRADPSKAQVYDKVIVGGSLGDLTPGPVSADIVDASEQIMRELIAWARYASTGEHAPGDFILAPGASAQVAASEARLAARAILAHLCDLANDAEQIDALCHFVLDQWLDDADRDVDDRGWTLARALGRWPLEERAWWAAQPCPMCDRRAVYVTPPRTSGGATTYQCRAASCGWSADDAGAGIPWWEFFSPVAGAAPIVQLDLVHDDA
jgi:hypothetical protein